MISARPDSAISRIGRRIETGSLVVLLGAMIALAATQIVLRNVFDSGLVWADPLLRIFVLWVAMVGGMAASRDQRHISIDVLTKFMTPRVVAVSAVAVSLFVAGICGLAGASTYVMVREAYDYGDTGLLGQPAWIFQSIMPVGFTLMAWRFLCHAGRNATLALGREGSTE